MDFVLKNGSNTFACVSPRQSLGQCPKNGIVGCIHGKPEPFLTFPQRFLDLAAFGQGRDRPADDLSYRDGSEQCGNPGVKPDS
jgi:hypothetical protein